MTLSTTAAAWVCCCCENASLPDSIVGVAEPLGSGPKEKGSPVAEDVVESLGDTPKEKGSPVGEDVAESLAAGPKEKGSPVGEDVAESLAAGPKEKGSPVVDDVFMATPSTDTVGLAVTVALVVVDAVSLGMSFSLTQSAAMSEYRSK